jgi:hypothetical protein
MDDCQRVDPATWTADAPIIQALTAATIWPTLSRTQRELVAACRKTVDPNAEYPKKYRVGVDALEGAPKATLRSLRRKGVVDERGWLTVVGIYTALWNFLERDKAKRERKAATA